LGRTYTYRGENFSAGGLTPNGGVFCKGFLRAWAKGVFVRSFFYKEKVHTGRSGHPKGGTLKGPGGT